MTNDSQHDSLTLLSFDSHLMDTRQSGDSHSDSKPGNPNILPLINNLAINMKILTPIHNRAIWRLSLCFVSLQSGDSHSDSQPVNQGLSL